MVSAQCAKHFFLNGPSILATVFSENSSAHFRVLNSVTPLSNSEAFSHKEQATLLVRIAQSLLGRIHWFSTKQFSFLSQIHLHLCCEYEGLQVVSRLSFAHRLVCVLHRLLFPFAHALLKVSLLAHMLLLQHNSPLFDPLTGNLPPLAQSLPLVPHKSEPKGSFKGDSLARSLLHLLANFANFPKAVPKHNLCF